MLVVDYLYTIYTYMCVYDEYVSTFISQNNGYAF